MAAMSLATAKAIQAGRATGKFNLSDRQLDVLPPELWDENLALPVPSTSTTNGPNWWEINAPQRLDVARNRLTRLPDAINISSWEGVTSLDVSNNQFNQLPAWVGQLFQLGTLTAHNNKLQSLPALPTSLVVVDLHHNQLDGVPLALGLCSQITTLDFSHNKVYGLPPQVPVGCTALVNLMLSNNQLTQLPETLGNLRKLKVLNIEYNQVRALPSSIGGCTSLVEVHAGYNRLQYLPPELSTCMSLRHLSARDNAITDYPIQLCSLQLGCLDLQNCNLNSLPPELGTMSTLRALKLDGNGLRSIRRALISGPVSALLSYLKSRLPEEDTGRPAGPVTSGNVFGVEPHQLAADAARKLTLASDAGGGGHPPRMAGFDGQGGHAMHGAGRQGHSAGRWGPGQGMPAPPPFATELTAGFDGAEIGMGAGVIEGAGRGQGVRAAGQRVGGGGGGGGGGARPVPELVLAGVGLQKVPGEVWTALPGLVKLDLSSNQITSIPPETWLPASQLRTLLLSRLPLAMWPLPWADPGCMSSLQVLSLAGCGQLRQIPPGSVCCCPNLVSLDLSGVPGGSNLPPGTIASLTQLSHLDLSVTGLSLFPHEALHLSATLRVLKLDTNRITALPNEICCMTRLDELHLANNELGQLPASLGLLSDTLKAVTLEGNPLRSIRRPILEKGTAAVLAYLKDRMPVPAGGR